MKLDGILLVLFASVWFSLGSMLIKLIGPEVPTAWVAFVRNLVSVPPFLLLMRYKRLGWASPNWARLILRGIWGCLAMSCFFWAIPRLPLATVVLLSSTQPIFAAVWGTLFMGERLDRFAVACIALSFVGVYVTLQPSFDAPDMLPYFTALAAGFFSSLAFVSIKSLSKDEPALRIIAYFAVVGTFFFLPATLKSGYVPAWPIWGLMVGVGMVTSVGQVFLTTGIGKAPVSRASIGVLFLVICNIFGGWVFWGEVPDRWTWLGSALILGGILGLTTNLRRRLLVTVAQ